MKRGPAALLLACCTVTPLLKAQSSDEGQILRAAARYVATKTAMGVIGLDTVASPLPGRAASRALKWELRSRGHHVTREFGVRVSYKGIDLGLLLHFGPAPRFYRVYVPNEPTTGS
jgi:hypothetical protein